MDELRPTLAGTSVTVRPGHAEDVGPLLLILGEPSVRRWWREPPAQAQLEGQLVGRSDEPLLVIDVAGEVAGGIQYYEQLEPDYRSASIDIFLGSQWQGRGIGTEAIRLLARFLFGERGHHRLTIDPSVGNVHAIAAYRKVGFKPVGVMRQYERQSDGRWHDGLLMDLLRDELAGD